MVVQGFGYLLFGSVVFVACIYVMFPYKGLREWVAARLSQGTLQVAITGLEPTFPPGVALKGVRLLSKRPNQPDEVMGIRTLRAWPKWLTLLSETKQVGFKGTLYDGEIAGAVGYATTTSGGPRWQSEVRFAGVDVAQYPLIQSLHNDKQLSVRGFLSGKAMAKLNPLGRLEQSNISFVIQQAVFAPGEGTRLPLRQAVPCDTLEGDVAMTIRQWEIDGLTCRGDDVFVDMRGTVRPRRPFQNSVLNLRMELRSDEVFKQELDLLRALVRQRPSPDSSLKFGLRGPIGRPRAVR